MSSTIGGRSKSKTNPKGLCKVCGKKIFNKDRNALYCIGCTSVRLWLEMRVGAIRLDIKGQYPGYNLKIRWKLRIKNGKANL